MEILDGLVRLGADVNIQSHNLRSPLHLRA